MDFVGMRKIPKRIVCAVFIGFFSDAAVFIGVRNEAASGVEAVEDRVYFFVLGGGCLLAVGRHGGPMLSCFLGEERGERSLVWFGVWCLS
jgi:hypothetical protein